MIKRFDNKVKDAELFIITVEDKGIGISKEDQKELFKPFFQSSDQQSRHLNMRGHGLGLSIVKLIAERLNGSIAVYSELNQGTTMAFTFQTSSGSDINNYSSMLLAKKKMKKKAAKYRVNPKKLMENSLEPIEETSRDSIQMTENSDVPSISENSDLDEKVSNKTVIVTKHDQFIRSLRNIKKILVAED